MAIRNDRSVFAAPAFIDDANVNIPPGLSRAGFESWARDDAEPVICSPPFNGKTPGNIACAGPPGWSTSAVTPGQPVPAAVEPLAARIAGRDYHGETIDVTENARLIARTVPVGKPQPAPVLARLVESGRATLARRPGYRPKIASR